jgi:hypothetical protein
LAYHNQSDYGLESLEFTPSPWAPHTVMPQVRGYKTPPPVDAPALSHVIMQLQQHHQRGYSAPDIMGPTNAIRQYHHQRLVAYCRHPGPHYGFAV